MTTEEDELRAAADRLTAARADERTAREDLAHAVRTAHQAGLTKYRIRQVTGLARDTVDKWAGD